MCSTRRLIVEEDEKGGGFLIQVSDSVAKQIYGIKEKPKVTKSNEPLKRKVIVEDKRKAPAVEAPPEKPQLPVPSFPVIPVIPATPILPPSPTVPVPGSPKKSPTSPKKSPTSPVTKPDLLSKEKGQKPVDSKSKEEAPVLSSKVEKLALKEPEKKESVPTSPVLSSKLDKTASKEAVKKDSIAAEPAEKTPQKVAEKKAKVEKLPQKEAAKEESSPAKPKAAPTAISEPAESPSQKPSPKKGIPGPKIPTSSFLQPLIPSPAAPKTELAAALAPAAEAESKEKELIAMERNHIYKQMNEIYVEREKAFRSIEEFYQEKMQSLQHQSTKMNTATRQEFAKAVEEVENKFLKHVEAPVCEDLQLKVLECYRTNQSHPLNCSAEVHAFATAVDQARQNVILAKKV